jgi:hypothetical protein
MAGSTFVYSTTVASAGGNYGWSANNNWSPSPPTAGSDVVIQPAPVSTDISQDDIPSLTINSLNVSATLVISTGVTLNVTGSAPGNTGVGIVNSSTIDLMGGSSLIATNSGDSGTYNLNGSKAQLTLGGDFQHAVVNFDGITADPEQFTLTAATVMPPSFPAPNATVANFGLGDDIYFDSTGFSGVTHVAYSGVAGSALQIENASNQVLYTIGHFSIAAADAGDSLGVYLPSGGGAIIYLICFAEGTRIATADGEAAVETLSPDDLVATIEDGKTVLRAVKWVGHRRIDLAAHPRPELASAVRIRANAFAPAMPKRDLLVSPDHCLFVDGKLIPAKLLINGGTIVQETGRRSITYFHVELDRHSILLAEGLPVESYLDTGNRAFFANAGMALMLHPEFHVNAGLKCWAQDACAPLAVSQEAVGPIWTRLAERAALLGHTAPRRATTEDPDLRLIAGGRTLRPASVDGNRHVFVLPRGTEGVTIASRIGFATDSLPYSDDWRRLGVAVTRIFVSRGADRIEVAVDHPMLTRGWHAPEQADGQLWRWTEGAAFLPVPTTDTGIVTVELELRGSMTYRIDEADRIAA